MKKFLINIVLILIIFVIYFLQSNFFNWFTIAGVMPNLFVIFILFVGLFANKMMGTIYGMVLGLFLDVLFREKIGVSFIALGLVGFIATIFDKNFSKDSRMTIMLMVAGLTFLYETIVYFANGIINSINIEILSFARILIIEIIFNLFIKGNKILTRYF